MNAMSHAPPALAFRAQMGYMKLNSSVIAKFGPTSTTNFTGSGAGANVDVSGNLGFVS
jgi:hypothetical protein